MATYPNQRTLKIKRKNVDKSTREPYLCIYNKSLAEASKKLNWAAYALYTFLMANADGYEIDFSPQYIENTYGMNRGTSHKALKELEEKGFMKKIGENKYLFYEVVESPKIFEHEKYEEIIDCSIKTLPKENNNIPTFLRSTHKKKEPVNYLDGVNWDED